MSGQVPGSEFRVSGSAGVSSGLVIRRCSCCGEEYDLDNCRCGFKCVRGCGRCERHCTGHVDSDLLLDIERDRRDDPDELEFRL
jgi:hypothetical protein